MIFDTHAHYDDIQYDEDREEVLNRIHAGGVECVVNIGADMQSSRSSVELAGRYDWIYAAVGVHPDEVYELTEQDISELEKLAENPKVVAIGEIGLDYHSEGYDKEVQKKWFIRQLELAEKLNKPVVIHSRDAAADTVEILKMYEGRCKGVVHCYAYSVENAHEYIKMGYNIGVGGVVTFKNAKKLKEVVSSIPLEKIVLETDAPYLAPEPFRGRRNESDYLEYVAAEIARIKETDKETVLTGTYKNAERLYKINSF